MGSVFKVKNEPCVQSPFAFSLDFVVHKFNIFEITFNEFVSGFTNSEPIFLLDGGGHPTGSVDSVSD